jgi:TonB family protein
MRLAWGRSLLTAAAAVVLAFPAVSAQQATEEGKRKVKSKTNPVLSDVARRMSITGKVKLEVTIAPDGRVKSVRALGGHPLLVQSCVECVKEWKYETAPEESIQIVEFDFKQS